MDGPPLLPLVFHRSPTLGATDPLGGHRRRTLSDEATQRLSDQTLADNQRLLLQLKQRERWMGLTPRLQIVERFLGSPDEDIPTILLVHTISLPLAAYPHLTSTSNHS
jgi:hypothetical protein